MSIPINRKVNVTVGGATGKSLASLAKGLENAQRAIADNVQPPGTHHRFRIADIFLGIIQSSGPTNFTNHADYTDERYWVRRAAPDPTGVALDQSGVPTNAISAVVDPNATSTQYDLWVTATNLSEQSTGTHLLTAGELVIVLTLIDAVQPTRRWYVFASGGSGQITPGQYQYSVYQMVSQRVAGFDWPRLHAPVS